MSTLLRVTITIPKDLVSGADRKARELDRSRSWVVAQAVREYLGRREPAPTAVREPALPPHTPGLGDQRAQQLRADLRLTPEERVRAGEENVRLGEHAHHHVPLQQIIQFDRFEDYLAWKKFAAIIV